ncbi:MAG TPA: tripartite tricarboxylate transporter substrate binding protein [Burkholderiales bacterium]|nr:tripartite tricarboxylate transporter substrate binding protein [Burkholderiales bacterium]
MNRRRNLICALVGGALFIPCIAEALGYPDKNVQYVVAFVPGGESDVMARWQQVVFRKKYRNELIVINKPGAGGALAWSQLNGMSADGYTIMGCNLPHIVLQPLEGNVQYKTEDITPVYWFHYTADALLVAADSPFKTFGDLVKAGKAKQGELTFGGSATFSANHLAHEKFNLYTGVKSTYVPFKGTGELIQAVVGKHLTGAMSYVPLALQQKTRLRMLAVALDKRHPDFPDVPTFKELGYKWVDGAYRGVAVPKSTPIDARKNVSDMMAALNKDPDILKWMAEGGFEVVDIPYDKNAAFVKERGKEYMEVAKHMGLVK